MDIKISLIENSINKIVSTALEQMEGTIKPTISKREGIVKLGTISEFILTLYEKAKENGINDNELEKIWDLKRKSDDNLQMLFEELYLD
ncbi:MULTISPECIES: hypothetical protein [Clostridium]|uniref:Uncharacterized protein n=2 Tax=Clostridium TaxID=1485 RepID=A0A1L7JPE8_CLOBO|nr:MULTISPECIES: hypothetical protein [Clostridium]APH16520.1 hypothetical protein NPD5_3923 [Clostridium sporogenes]APU87375.1 hypothetical protein NPD8_3960 [Clostridium botulinum]MBD5639466.1 hypothetical protein [Clostridium botulinum]MDI6918989.1 hypothetical protein [Clostridium botulinum]WMU99793.1 hypothetical protein QA656_19360 [Clostridium botulinum]